MNRRQFLATMAAASLALRVAPAAATTAHYDVSYIWTSERSEALDYMTQVKELLGYEVAVRLELVQNIDGLYGVIYNLRYGTRDQARDLAARHDALLREALGGRLPLALPLPDDNYSRLYNVSYGLGPDLEELKQRYLAVSQILGPGVTSRLFVEHTDRGNYALVYKRYGTLEKTRELATAHGALLAPHGLEASFIKERNNAIVYGSTTQGAVAQAGPKPTRQRREPRRARRSKWSHLKTEINEYVQVQRRDGVVERDEVTSWLVYDLRSDQMLASIHEDAPRQCASMVKPLLALAFFHETASGRFVYGPRSTAKFTAMIQHSDNTATNWVFQQVGGPDRVQQILTRSYPRIFKNIDIVEDIGAGGRTYRNRASAGDYCRFLRALWLEELPYSSELKRLMNLPGRDRLYYGAPSIPVGTEVYNKTGSTSRLCGDMGILVARDQRGGRFPYVMVGIIEKERRADNYSSWIYARSRVIRGVSDLTYSLLKEPFRLA
ncbi:MAG: beta-lactamase class A [Myxococcota bacterium]